MLYQSISFKRLIFCIMAIGLLQANSSLIAQSNIPELYKIQKIIKSENSPYSPKINTSDILFEPGAIENIQNKNTLNLPLFHSDRIIISKMYVVKRSPTDFSWSGRYIDDAGIPSYVVLTVKLPYISGYINSSFGIYRIESSRKVYQLHEIDTSQYPPESEPLIPPVSLNTDTLENQIRIEPDRSNSVTINVMILYTSTALEARPYKGDKDIMEDAIENIVDMANLAMKNSHVDVEFDLVHTQEITPVNKTGEAGELIGFNGQGKKMLSWLQEDQYIHNLRNTHKADLVSMLTQNLNDNDKPFCGFGYQLIKGHLPENGGDFSPFAYQVTKIHCALNKFTWLHEHGHNLGLQHDLNNIDDFFLRNTIDQLAQGYFKDGAFRTIMSYSNGCTNNNCPRIPHFSTPWVNYGNAPTGVDSTQNASVLTKYAHIAAGYR